MAQKYQKKRGYCFVIKIIFLLTNDSSNNSQFFILRWISAYIINNYLKKNYLENNNIWPDIFYKYYIQFNTLLNMIIFLHKIIMISLW